MRLLEQALSPSRYQPGRRAKAALELGMASARALDPAWAGLISTLLRRPRPAKGQGAAGWASSPGDGR